MNPRLRVVLAAVMVLTATFSVVTEYDNGWPKSFFPDPALFAVVTTLVLLAYQGAGLLAWQRHPGERTGLLFCLVGWWWFVPMIGALHSSLAWTIGELTTLVWQASIAHLALAWPFGRLRSRFEVALIAVTYVWGFLSQVLQLAFYDPRPGCAVCVSNLLLVHSSPSVLNELSPYKTAVSAVLAASLTAVAAWHWLSARGYLRRQMNLFALAALTPLAYLVLFLLWENGAGGISYVAANGYGPILLLSPPVAYIVRVLRAQRAERAVGTALVDVAPAVVPGTLRDALARALGDPSLQLAFGSAAAGVLVDTDGAVLDLATMTPGRVVTRLDDAGQAVLVHDEQLFNEPELLRVTAAAANLALEHARLRAEVEARLEDVQASRARIVEAADAARRRLERDLHDGAQQRLVTLALALGMAQDRAGALDDDLAELLDTASTQAREALAELRELARGIHPAVLTQAGLLGAIEALVDRSPLRVTVDEVVPGRLPEAIEATVYFVVSEALTNAAKHAPGASVRVAVRDEGGAIRVEIADTGPGGARLEAGSGLTGLTDRVASLGGSFAVTSPPGLGTRIEVSLPLSD